LVRPKTRVALSGTRTSYSFEQDAAFLGSYLNVLLNRREDVATIELRHDLTPLTAFVLEADAGRDRFRLSPDRNADSVRLWTGFDLSRFALIAGRVRVGYRKYDALGTQVRDYRGPVASVDVVTTLRGSLHIIGVVKRDIEYSYLFEQPYYLLTGGTIEATQRFSRHFDVQLRGARQTLEYRVAPGIPLHDGRFDRILLGGLGIGFRTHDEFRISANAEQTIRSSSTVGRPYERLRIWTAVTYGR
jgi:hypothetical protein